MCYHNYTQHNGCGHIGECHTTPWTLCPAAEQRLASLRGPLSPPIISPSLPSSQPPPKPAVGSTNNLSRRFASFSLSRSSTSAGASSPQRSASGPPPKAPARASTSPFFLNDPATGSKTLRDVPEHQLNAVKCTGGNVVRRTNVSSQMEVCKECMRWICEMRHLIRRYEKTGSVKGTVAFEEFLKYRGDLGFGGEGASRGEY